MQPVCVCVYLCVAVCICQSVCACLYCLPYIGSPLTQPSAIMCMAVCCVLGGCISPRAGLIGVKQASVKSHQRLEKLSETGNLLLGDFLQMLDSVCPCLSYCLSLYPSLLKSLITAQFPSALFLSHSLSVGFKHSLFITPSPTLDARALSLSLYYCFYV